MGRSQCADGRLAALMRVCRVLDLGSRSQGDICDSQPELGFRLSGIRGLGFRVQGLGWFKGFRASPQKNPHHRLPETAHQAGKQDLLRLGHTHSVVGALKR